MNDIRIELLGCIILIVIFSIVTKPDFGLAEERKKRLIAKQLDQSRKNKNKKIRNNKLIVVSLLFIAYINSILSG